MIIQLFRKIRCIVGHAIPVGGTATILAAMLTAACCWNCASHGLSAVASNFSISKLLLVRTYMETSSIVS
jgi:hypothetical protein